MVSLGGLKKYLSNTSWMFADRIFRMVFGLGIAIWFARYLGPEQFGIFNYALFFIALFSIISTLGLDKLVTKELLSKPEDSQLTMGTSFVLRFVGAAVLIPLTAVSVSLIRPDSEIIFTLVVIFSIGFFFKSFEIIKYWFESHVQAKYRSVGSTDAKLPNYNHVFNLSLIY
ncbi:MAG: oligosaccharide flippase family protein [Pseudomonadota bacterium]|nr:oligosaccharide flippase family protein [Pseudomonadota bacterium]